MIDEERIPILEFVFSYVYKKIKDFIRINYVAKKHETKYKLSDTIFFYFYIYSPQNNKNSKQLTYKYIKSARQQNVSEKRGLLGHVFLHFKLTNCFV